MTAPGYRGCVWPMTPDWTDDETAKWDQGTRDLAIQFASVTLESLTGFRVGNCPVKVRPVRTRPVTSSVRRFLPHLGYGWGPMNINGEWSNGCGAPSPCTIALAGPVGRLDEVRSDGVALDPASYRLDNGVLLRWIGVGDCPWHLDQDLSLPDTAAGTTSITYLHAYPVDSVGAAAAGRMAREFAAAITGKGACALPAGTTSVSRQGVNITIAPGSFPDGNTGIRMVDAFVRLWNPSHRRQGMTVWSPDLDMPVVGGIPGQTEIAPGLVIDGGDASTWPDWTP